MNGILKSLEIEYRYVSDLAFCTPTVQYKLIIINFCASLYLFLLDPNNSAKYETLQII